MIWIWTRIRLIDKYKFKKMLKKTHTHTQNEFIQFES